MYDSWKTACPDQYSEDAPRCEWCNATAHVGMRPHTGEYVCAACEEQHAETVYEHSCLMVNR